jgi:hypothetical protein
VLSRVFRGKFLNLLRAAFDRGKLAFPGRLAPLAQASAFAGWLASLYAKDWVVYAKPPFGGPGQVLKYLSRYTHRVAISNQRLLTINDGQVTFRYKDYAGDQRQRTLTLAAEEFLRRFVQHVLPKSFVKVRHYGLLANRQRRQRLDQCRRLLLVATHGGGVVSQRCCRLGRTDLRATLSPLRQQPHCPQGHLAAANSGGAERLLDPE